MNLFQEFLWRAQGFGDAPMVHDFSESECRVTTYAGALRRIDTVTNHLKSEGLKKGARVAILSENRAEWLIAYFAAVSLGLVVVPLEAPWPLAAREEMEGRWVRLLRHSETEILFVSDRYQWVRTRILDEVPTLRRAISFDEEEWAKSVKEYLGTGPMDRPSVKGYDPASLVYTSGTTGEPKGVLVSHENLWCSHSGALNYSEKGSVGAVLLPLYHLYGFHCALAWIMSGTSIILYQTLSPPVIFESFKKLKPHGITSVPAFYEKMAEKIRQAILPKGSGFLRKVMDKWVEWTGEQKNLLLRKIRKGVFFTLHRRLGGRIVWLLSGGAPIDPGVRKLLSFVGFRFWEGYGLTETAPVISSNDWRGECAGSVGLPYSWVELKLGAPDDLGWGEICVRGKGVMLGYYKNPEATAEVIDQDGWFHTGDLGFQNQEGFLFVTGRKKDMIVTANGKKIVPADLEKFFSRIPLVQEACVFGLNQSPGSGKIRDEVVHLEVVPDFEVARSLGLLSSGEVERAVKKAMMDLSDQLPDYHRPRSFGVSNSPFPRSSTLKVRRFLVKEQVLSRQKNREPEGLGTHLIEEIFGTPVGEVVGRILRKVIPPQTPLFSESHFSTELGMDSLTLMEFWSLVGIHLQVPISEKEVARLRTVREVVQYLESRPEVRRKVQEGGRGPDVESATLSGWDTVLGNLRRGDAEKVGEVVSCFPRFRPLFLALFRRIFRLTSGLTVQGLENLPRKGPYILAPNHQSHLDNLFVACFMTREAQANMLVMGKKEHWDRWVTRNMARLCHAFPVNRENVSLEPLQVCAEILRQRKILLIHPEGTRTPDGKLLPFKNGVALLAQHFQCPVVPVFIEGAYEFWPKDSLFPRCRSRITVSFGRPLVYQGGRPAEFTERLVSEVRALRLTSDDPPSASRPLKTNASDEIP